MAKLDTFSKVRAEDLELSDDENAGPGGDDPMGMGGMGGMMGGMGGMG
eukprot:CAMPEP_0206033000 /NCGR_PEP_ID=MMETSP1466-20131121/350_1 /ASSEMBLY_ACC=CAM_ASM_001126 /TAXON_ID=44452 /ORGANISM="Pavlova gyrans, Strain CCMP608" /LENGTH=47 /DNA_ID= /DNA_START= /DNA_END= /DNA_ORIENTATION=